MKISKIRVSRNITIYLTCTISTILVLFGLNWILQLPQIVHVIGDENTWLPIVADSIVSGMIFIAGNWASNADRLRNIIVEKKNDFNQISSSVNRVVNSLNISRKQLSILYSIEISMETPTLIKEVLAIQQEIDEAHQDFSRIKYLISDQESVSSFEDSVNTVTSAYHIVFDQMQKILNEWISTVSKSTQAKTMADYIGKENDKTTFALTYISSSDKLLKEKEKLLKVYDSQKTNVEIMFGDIQDKGRQILESEYREIYELENKLK